MTINQDKEDEANEDGESARCEYVEEILASAYRAHRGCRGNLRGKVHKMKRPS